MSNPTTNAVKTLVVKPVSVRPKRSRRNNGRRGRKPSSLIEVAPVSAIKQSNYSVAKFTNTKTGTRVAHKEMIRTVNGSTAYEINWDDINPGLAASFPWLYTIASRYEQYTVHKLSFHFVTLAPTTKPGLIMLAPDYDPNDEAPTTERLLMQSMGAKQGPIYTTEMTITFDPLSINQFVKRHYVRTGPISGDWKTFDVGSLWVATTGCEDTSEIGRIWVSYDIEFFNPQPTGGIVADKRSSLTSFYTLKGPQHTYVLNEAFCPIWEIESRRDALSWGVPDAGGAFHPPPGVYMVQFVFCFVVTSYGGSPSNMEAYGDALLNGASIFPNAGIVSAYVGHNNVYHTMTGCLLVAISSNETFELWTVVNETSGNTIKDAGAYSHFVVSLA